ncbi:unnamed protein product [Lactuca saligna]|uniref:Uncharacterized protein n=1 Tax=Lactuca saligna TaxID=75948 RepID=A0AA35ZXZ7_LACSI|nr:unnamed protein product [Lactuca saligna]
MFYEIGYQPHISLISSFKKLNLPSVWSFFFGITVRCLSGRNCGLDKVSIEIASARFWSLNLHETFSQAGIQVPEDVETTQISTLIILKDSLDDPMVFLVFGKILDVILNLVSASNQFLIQYKASLDITSFSSTLKNVTFKEVDSSSKASQVVKKKKSTLKPKVVTHIFISEKPNGSGKTVKGVSKRKKTQSDLEKGVPTDSVLDISVLENFVKKLKTKSKSSGVVIKE